MQFQAPADRCNDLDYVTAREWLETDGRGGYASSTIACLNTRRYHGLFVPALQPPVSRAVLLSKLECTVVVDGEPYELSSNRYPGTVHPAGYRLLSSFRLDPFPVWTWRCGAAVIEQSLFLAHGDGTLAVRYRLLTNDALQIQVRPLIAFRDYHALTRQNDALKAEISLTDRRVSIEPYSGMPRLNFAYSHGGIEKTGDWYRNFVYEREAERGLDSEEDLYQPFVISAALTSEQSLDLLISLEVRDASEYESLLASELTRRAAFKDDRLASAASHFIVPRGEGATVIAGYHWFTDWGRDTMISFAGLTLCSGRFEIARSILRTFAQSVSDGMVPNRFPDGGEAPEYNTVDATLWFVEAVRAYAAATGDISFVKTELYPVLCDIVTWHIKGTRFGIHVDDDGLLISGAPGVQLTWMDAKVGDWVVTPRTGKPVEIQALWFNAISTVLDFARQFNDEHSASAFQLIHDRIRKNFLPLFWNAGQGCLYDVVNGSDKDASIRPNQLFAASLHHPLLDNSLIAQVLAVVDRELLTPYGLRTLSPHDRNYQGHYGGDQRSRDAAYHQGTVWPWLIGAYIDAYLRLNGDAPEQKQHCQNLLAPLLSSLDDAGLGQLSEIHDGDAPHSPRGCIAQAWSVAEVLRAYHKTILHRSKLPEHT